MVKSFILLQILCLCAVGNSSALSRQHDGEVSHHQTQAMQRIRSLQKGKGMGMKGKKDKKAKKGMMGTSTPYPTGTFPPLPPGKGNGKGKGKGNTYDDAFFPDVDDITFLDDKFFDDGFFNGDGCELVTLNDTFAIPRAARYLAPDTTPTNMGDPTLVGTIFIWEDQPIYEVDGVTPINGTTVSGTCIRITEPGDAIASSASCQLTYVSDKAFTITIGGILAGPLGSPLSITGGTGGMVGVIGSMDFFPVYPAANGDILIDATSLQVQGDLGLIVCPPPAKSKQHA